MHYTLHQLRIFEKVAEFQSITKAAEELHLTQPAISIQLKKLQDQFELPLTEVVGRQLYITDFGKEIVKRSKRILEEADGIKYTVDQYKGLLTGKIKIASVSTGKYVIPFFLKTFIDLHPGVDISIDVSNKGKVVEGIIKNESDFSLVSVLPEGLDLQSVTLMENKLFLIGSGNESHNIKQPKDLEKVNLVYREEGSATRKAMERYLESHQVTINKSMELVSNEAVKQAVMAGIGYSIMPLIGLRNALITQSLTILPLADLPLVSSWNLVYRSGKQLTPAQKALIDHIERHKTTIVQEHFAWVSDYNDIAFI